jgi:hypothetical protein
VIPLRLSQEVYDELRKAVRDPRGWYELQSEEGVVALDLREVVFVKSEGGAHGVGF